MSRIVACLALLLAFGGPLSCRIFLADEWDRRDRCAEHLPIYRAEPGKPYRIVEMLEDSSDLDMAWRACAVGAQALLAYGRSGDTATGFGANAFGNTVTGSVKTSRSKKLEGAAIVFTDDPSAQ